MSDAMRTTARDLVAPGKGILAADESTGTIGKRFDQIGVPNTEDARRRYRELLFTTPGLGEHISGVILFDETIRQSTDDGVPFVKVLRGGRLDPGHQGRHRGQAAGVVPERDRDRGPRRSPRDGSPSTASSAPGSRSGAPRSSSATGRRPTSRSSRTHTRWRGTRRCARKPTSCRSSSPRS